MIDDIDEDDPQGYEDHQDPRDPQSSSEDANVGVEDFRGSDLSEEQLATLEHLMGVPVTVSLEVGSSVISIKDLLQLNQGSVIELDRNAGDPLDIKVNGRILAHGEVVVINNKFGVRLTNVVSLSDRIKRFDR